jgi:predicted alpha/beta hydrolase family esterase
VGHSCGGGFLVRWLSENKDKKVGKVVLVAPWLDPNKTKGKDNDFFDFTTDSFLVSRTQGVTIFNSDDDMEAVHVSVKQIMDSISNVKLIEFQNKGHFCLGDLKGEAFPELLDEVLN